MDQLNFEKVSAQACAGLTTDDETIERARVPGGWIVIYDHGQRVCFYADTAPWNMLGPSGQSPKPELRRVA